MSGAVLRSLSNVLSRSLPSCLSADKQDMTRKTLVTSCLSGRVLAFVSWFTEHSRLLHVCIEDMVCFEPGMYYAEPTKLEGTARTVELSAEACQQRCQVVEDCAHFTFWPDGGCLLTPEISYPKATPVKFSATVSGPKFCDVPAAHAADAAGGSATWGAAETPTSPKPLAGINGTTCSKYPACVAAGDSPPKTCLNI